MFTDRRFGVLKTTESSHIEFVRLSMLTIVLNKQHKREAITMYSMIPAETLAGALEIVCCFFTLAVAMLSYVLTLRF